MKLLKITKSLTTDRVLSEKEKFVGRLSGHMLLSILSGFTFNIMCFGFIFFILALIPLAFIIAFSGLELAIAFIQAQVFVILTCSYIKDAIELHG